MESVYRIKWIFFAATAYMIFAFAWWTILLIRKNEDAREAKIELLQLGMRTEQIYTDSLAFIRSARYNEINHRYDRQKDMIWEEGIFIFLGFLLGIWFINETHNKEVALSNQRRNFLLSITHELKSPLASIQLILQTFLKRKLEKPQTDKLIHSALSESDRLNQLINNLLLSAKLETAYTPQLEDISLEVLVDEIVEKMKTKFPNANIVAEKAVVPVFSGEKLGIASILLNLVENAVKYSKDIIDVRVRYYYGQDKFHIEIADQGIGVPDKEKKKIFEKFYRLGNEYTRQTKGTGLGLFIVDQIVKAHKGSIQALDNHPKGSLFKISLPNRL